MTTYRKATLNEIRAGAVVWVDAETMGLPDSDERVNDGRTAVRVLDADASTNGSLVVCGMPAIAMTRAPVACVLPSRVWIQTGNPGDPLLPGAIQEAAGKAPTQMVYPAGIDMSKVGTPGPAAVDDAVRLRPRRSCRHQHLRPAELLQPASPALRVPGAGQPRRRALRVLARPAIMHADDTSWQMECPTCPLAANGPPMVCAAGTRLPNGGFMMGMHCPHNHGLRAEESGKISTGCSYSGVENGH